MVLQVQSLLVILPVLKRDSNPHPHGGWAGA